MADDNDWVAPEGTIWVCGACGKLSPHKTGGKDATYGWDSSCFSNAVLCRKDSVVLGSNGRATEADAVEESNGSAERKADL